MADHPDNLFTLLGGRYHIDAFERETLLCPSGTCQEDTRSSFGGRLGGIVEDASVVFGHLLLPSSLGDQLPSVSQSWQDFLHVGQDEPARFDRFLQTLGPSSRPKLSYFHVLLPHSPWQYLPSGARYTVRYPVAPWKSSEVWDRDPGLVLQNWQRHLLQLAYTDRLLGRLLARLRETGVYDRALVIVTGDEGISFRAGRKRRPAWPDNLHDVAFVPLFVKLPGQATGSTNEAHVPTMDVLPTIAATLGIRIPWRVDGRSVFAAGGPQRNEVAVLKDSGQKIAAPLREVLRRRYVSLARQLALFGWGRPASSLFGIGRYRALLGQRPRIRTGTAGSVRLDRGRSPLEVSGRVDGATDVAVAVDGRIAAVVPVYDRRFWALLPAPATGVRVLAISGDPRSPRLRRLRVA